MHRSPIPASNAWGYVQTHREEIEQQIRENEEA